MLYGDIKARLLFSTCPDIKKKSFQYSKFFHSDSFRRNRLCLWWGLSKTAALFLVSRWIICRVEFQWVETSCIKDSDFWLNLLCFVWSSTSFAGLCLKWPTIGFSGSIKFGLLHWPCLFFQLHVHVFNSVLVDVEKAFNWRFHQLIPSTKCVFATQMILLI